MANAPPLAASSLPSVIENWLNGTTPWPGNIGNWLNATHNSSRGYR